MNLNIWQIIFLAVLQGVTELFSTHHRSLTSWHKYCPRNLFLARLAANISHSSQEH